MSDQSPDRAGAAGEAPPIEEQRRIEAAAQHAGIEPNFGARVMASSVGRNLGLVGALALIMIIGTATAGDRFADWDNFLTILRLSAVIGVVSVGMTFVIIGGGIDLSVGAIVALAAVWSTTVASQNMAEDTHWLAMLMVAMLVGAGCGLINGVLVAYGKMAPFIVTLAMLASARGLAELISDKRNQIVRDRDLIDFFNGDIFGIPVLVYVFAIVAAAGWVRSTEPRTVVGPSRSEEIPRQLDSRASRFSDIQPRCTSCSGRRVGWRR